MRPGHWPLAALALCVWPALAPAQPPQEHSISEERAELFLALLRRRALQALETHRKPEPPAPVSARRWALSADLAQGYESNPLLDAERRGDWFTQESLAASWTPQITSWLEAEFTYDLLNSHYLELRDANILMNSVGTAWRVTPHPRLQTQLSYEYGAVDFPFDTSSSFFDHRVGLQQQFTWLKGLTQRVGWRYQHRAYDTRKAREGDGTDRRKERADQRHALLHDWGLRWKRTFLKVGTQWHENLSNDAADDFYDWQAWQLQGVVSHVFNPRWIASTVASHEWRHYADRPVPAINVAERDHLLTLAGSLIYLVDERWQVAYSVTYRYQDSNDPRLDFTDWIQQCRLSWTF